MYCQVELLLELPGKKAEMSLKKEEKIWGKMNRKKQIIQVKG
jgi:hypothetical protein